MRGIPPFPAGAPVDHPVLAGLCAIGAVVCTVQFVRAAHRAARAAAAGDAAAARALNRRALLCVLPAFALYALVLVL